MISVCLFIWLPGLVAGPHADNFSGAYLKNTLLAYPNRSMYGFCLNHLKPGYLSLLFLSKPTKDGGEIQEWLVRLLPGAYALNNAEVPGINELCNAFKAQYSSRLSEQGMGGKTPGIRAGRTPAHALGGKTPGGRTPALGGATPYGAGMGRTPAVGLGGATPYGAGVGRTPIRPGMTPNPCQSFSSSLAVLHRRSA